MSLFSPIHHTFAPLGDRRQRGLVLRASYAPWKYRRGGSTEEFRKELEKKFGGNAFLFASGREALLALLQSLKLTPHEEVIVQAYTCVVVPNAIKAAGMAPVYSDIGKDTLNIDLEDLERKVTPKTRVVICQHTFGIPADTKGLRAFCDRRSLILIEDCAHVLPDKKGPDAIGTYGDFLLLSFGRDKAISGITGGAVVCRTPHAAPGLRTMEKKAIDLSWWSVARLLEYPQIYGFARPFYGIGIGKAFLRLARMCGFLVPILGEEEKEGTMPGVLHCLPNVCARLALDQLRRLQELNDHRRKLAEFYLAEGRKRHWPLLAGIGASLPLQKFPLFVKNAEKIRRVLKKKNIHLYDGWTGCVVCPADVDMPETGYELGNDPNAEAVCEEILSLPTHPTMTMAQARELVEALDPLLTGAV